MTHRSRQLHVSALSRVEGEGALRLVVRDGEVEAAELNIYEPPRFFEGLLRGRGFDEPPDITARICGICPVAYQTSACNALETIAGVQLDPALRDLRRLLYCGEWIASHALHIYLLHAPDFLGFPDVVALAGAHPDSVERGLSLKKAGNALLRIIGGRAIHPIGVRVGGFYSVPTPDELRPVAGQLERALEQAVETVRWVSTFEMPDLQLDHQVLALQGVDRYPIEQGDIARSNGPPLTPAQLPHHVTERQVPHSTALHATLDGQPYLTGPTARYALNAHLLPPVARHAAEEARLSPADRNPFRSVVTRAVEVVAAIEEALRIIGSYEPPARPCVDAPARPGVGHGVSEAPRGLLYHRYEVGDDGLVRSADIVPPTSQNQAVIEAALRQVASANLGLDDGELTSLCERTIRSFDPCISCAAHFVRLTVDRR